MLGSCVHFRRMRYNKELAEGRRWGQNMLDSKSPQRMRVGPEIEIWADGTERIDGEDVSHHRCH